MTEQAFSEVVIMRLDQLHEEMQELKTAQARLDRETRQMVSDLKLSIVRLETKLAMYASMGAVVGSAIMTWVLEQLRH